MARFFFSRITRNRPGIIRAQGQAFLFSYFLVLIIYMSVLMYGIYVMRGVLEEKSSRIVERASFRRMPFPLSTSFLWRRLSPRRWMFGSERRQSRLSMTG